MSSQAQIDANRLNAQKSTGPRTPAGRAAVRLNGVTHGLSAKTLVIKDETESDFQAIFDSLEAEHQPTTPTEELLVSQLAMAAWRLRRLYHLESSFISVSVTDLEPIFQNYKNLGPFDRHAIAVDRDGADNDTFSKLGRFEARLERTFYRALHELQRLRNQRLAEAQKVEKEVEKPELGLLCNNDPRKASAPKSRTTHRPSPNPPPIPTPPAPDVTGGNADEPLKAA